jgi:hypothetical protein
MPIIKQKEQNMKNHVYIGARWYVFALYCILYELIRKAKSNKKLRISIEKHEAPSREISQIRYRSMN